MDNFNIIIAGGGTGGHLFPAIAIGEELKERIPNARIHYIGSIFGLEAKVFPIKDLLHTLLPIRGLQRDINIKSFFRNLLLPYRIIDSYLKVNSLFKEFSPKLIIGTGGYASAMPLFVATRKKYSIPIILQEQNSFPGLTTRCFKNKATLICTAFKFENKIDNIVFTGNPIRKNINNGKKNIAYKEYNLSKDKNTLFVFGGSQGSAFLNKSISRIIKKFNQKHVQILWQTGETEYNKYKSFTSKSVKVISFINDMANAYAISDLVVCRSGALTISEITTCGKPSILIPFSAAAGNHQLKNAKTLHIAGASNIIQEKELNSRKLFDSINNLINNKTKLNVMSLASKKLGKPNATKNIVNYIMDLKNNV